jgi:hypothetical protein
MGSLEKKKLYRKNRISSNLKSEPSLRDHSVGEVRVRLRVLSKGILVWKLVKRRRICGICRKGREWLHRPILLVSRNITNRCRLCRINFDF